jgi:beta-lactamase regulating signal transducer with metallopeptidase domain
MLVFAYSFLMCLLHSLWQAGILYVLYAGAAKTILSKASPVSRRNLLLLAITLQLIISTISFLLYYFQPATELAALQLSAYLPGTESIFYTASPWLMAAYFIILAIRTTNILLSWYRFRQLYKTGLQKPSAGLKVFTMLTAHRLGIRKKVQVWLSNTISTPVVFGYFKPVILLPMALVNQLSLQQAEALVVHELTHIKVNDYLLNWFLSAIEIIFFFNPFVQKLCSHAKLEREKHCDTNVLYFGSNALLYAETLLLAAKIQRERKNWQLAAVGNKKILLQRIRFFTGTDVYHFSKRKASLALAPLIAVSFMSVMAVLMLLPLQQQSKVVAIATLVRPDASTIENQVYSLPSPPQLPKIPIAATTTEVAKAKAISRKINTGVNAAIKPLLTEIPVTAEGMLNVTFDNNELDREVIIEEQASGSKSKSLKVYILGFKNGQWVLTPKWVATSQRILVDTNLLKKDSLYIRMEQ